MRETIRKFDPQAEFFFDEGCFIVELDNFPDDPGLSIARARVEPGVTTRLHRLRGVTERYVIMEGAGLVEIGSLPAREVGPCDVVIIPPGCAQRITNIGSCDLIFLAICAPRFLPAIYEDIEKVAGIDDVGDFEGIEGIGDIGDIGDIEDIEDVEDIGDVEDIENAGDVEGVVCEPGFSADIYEDVEAVKDIEGIEDIEDVEGVVREPRFLEDIYEDIEDIEDAEGIGDIKDVEDVKAVNDIKSVEGDGAAAEGECEGAGKKK